MASAEKISIKLINGSTYWHRGRTYNKNVPVAVDKRVADYLVKTGKFVIEAPVSDAPKQPPAGQTGEAGSGTGRQGTGDPT